MKPFQASKKFSWYSLVWGSAMSVARLVKSCFQGFHDLDPIGYSSQNGLPALIVSVWSLAEKRLGIIPAPRGSSALQSLKKLASITTSLKVKKSLLMLPYQE